jgi:uncharacterized protein (DUF58 family)
MLVAQIRRIEIRARRAANAALAGDYRSVFYGSGIEFAEAREYVPGDDVRRIDWNVTARMGTPWVKEYVEERELTVVCALDVSASQLVARAPEGRIGAAAELCALFAYLAALHHDRAALLTFSDRIERFVPPARGTRHALRIVREALQHPPPARGTSIGAACEYLSRVLRRRSVVLLLSDFYDAGYESALRTLARRHDVIALPLTDPLDAALPDLGLVELEDAERGTRLLVDTSDPRVRTAYAHAAEERVRARTSALAAAGVDAVPIEVGGDLVRPVARYFRRRAARR